MLETLDTDCDNPFSSPKVSALASLGDAISVYLMEFRWATVRQLDECIECYATYCTALQGQFGGFATAEGADMGIPSELRVAVCIAKNLQSAKLHFR